MSLISAEKVSIHFGRQPILRNISFNIPRGQTLTIIGESGCGKTVLLKLLIGLQRPMSGRIFFDGKELLKLPERELMRERLRFGFLFQGAALFDSMNVYDNIAFGLRENRKGSAREIEEIVLARLAEVGLPPDAAAKWPAELSGGMKKRVGLARALAMDPEVMVYDEPTTGLDPIMSDVINSLILQTRRRRPVTSIVVTHDMKTVWKTADRVIMLYPLSRLKDREPQILFDGSPHELRDFPDERVVQFVQNPPQEPRTE